MAAVEADVPDGAVSEPGASSEVGTTPVSSAVSNSHESRSSEGVCKKTEPTASTSRANKAMRGARPKSSTIEVHKTLSKNVRSKKRLPKNFNFEKSYFDLLEKYTTKEHEHKFLLETVGQLSAEKEDLQVNSQLLVIANNQSIDRLNALTDERPEAEKIDELTKIVQERDFFIQEYQMKEINDGAEIAKLQKEVNICRSTISLIKGQIKDKDEEVDKKDSKIANLKEQLAEYKRESLLRLRESNTKTLGLSTTLQHLVKTHEETLAGKNARITKLTADNEGLHSLQTTFLEENDALKQTNAALEMKITKLDEANQQLNVDLVDKEEIIELLKMDVARYKNKTFGRKVKNLFGCRSSRRAAYEGQHNERPEKPGTSNVSKRKDGVDCPGVKERFGHASDVTRNEHKASEATTKGTKAKSETKTVEAKKVEPQTPVPIKVEPKAPVEAKKEEPQALVPAKVRIQVSEQNKVDSRITEFPQEEPKTLKKAEQEPKAPVVTKVAIQDSLPDTADTKESTSAEAEPKALSPVNAEPKALSPVNAEPKALSPVNAEHEAASPVNSEQEAASPVNADSKALSPVNADPKAPANAKAEPKTPAPTKAETKNIAETTDPKCMPSEVTKGSSKANNEQSKACNNKENDCVVDETESKSRENVKRETETCETIDSESNPKIQTNVECVDSLVANLVGKCSVGNIARDDSNPTGGNIKTVIALFENNAAGTVNTNTNEDVHTIGEPVSVSDRQADN
ncbi:neurofilament heavy polypeptide-like [Clytia hemisphaerica]|uniref:neurofilament heavy polypeptide-like n=1 Tax=Clytia hemisphaerica TaxID=252671 RepID=UPI0034D3E8AE